MRRKSVWWSVFFIAILPALLSRAEEQVTLRVSEGFATPPLVETSVAAQGKSVMELLQATADVQTAYGGGFVSAIDGLRSGASTNQHWDWFYYVNGLLAHVGAATYLPQPGDHIWWVYHQWEQPNFIPAVIGAYPQPFVNGYGTSHLPTRILYHPTLSVEAEQLGQSLREQGVLTIQSQVYKGEVPETPTAHLILVCPWTGLSSSTFAKTVERQASQLGWWVRFRGKAIECLDLRHQVIKKFRGSVGLIAAIRYGSLDQPAIVCLITGTDLRASRRAAHIMTHTPERIRGWAAMAVTDAQLCHVPAVGLRVIGSALTTRSGFDLVEYPCVPR